MKKLSVENTQKIVGGGCGKWVRRYNRAYNNGADAATLDAIRHSLDDCIYEKYVS